MDKTQHQCIGEETIDVNLENNEYIKNLVIISQENISKRNIIEQENTKIKDNNHK